MRSIELWRTPEPTPDARRYALFQQDIIAVHEQQEGGVFFRQYFPWARSWKLCDASALVCLAIGLHRACAAIGLAARANCRAQIHQSLYVGSDIALRQQCFGLLPKMRLDFFLASKTCNRKITCQHAFDVAIQNGTPLMQREYADGGSCRTPDAGQLEYLFKLARKFAVIFFCDDLRGAMQVAPARIVAQPAPVRQYFIFTGNGKRSDIREARDEALVIWNDSGNLSLLQHDLGQPYVVGIRTLPRQAVATMLVLPFGDACRKLTHVIGRG